MDRVVPPSSQVDSNLPLWIRSPDTVVSDGLVTEVDGTLPTRTRYRSENHKNFVNFMTKSFESEERIGFGQDILQNLQKYKDFDTYKDKIVQYSFLTVSGSIGDYVDGYYRPLSTSNDENILAARPIGDALRILTEYKAKTYPLYVSKNQTEAIELVDGRGFPEKNGVILIDDEVILYRRREGNTLYELQRGSSATTFLPSFRDSGEYVRTEPADHYAGSVVVNLSVLFLVSILDTIHKTYTHNIDSSRVVPEINRSSLLQNIKDFFKSKGSKLGIKALFKILFAENDVDVFYPGDRMITPSKSSWVQPLILRTVQIPDIFCDPKKSYTTPDKVIGSRLEFKSYSATILKEDGKTQTYQPEDLFATSQVDYVSTYPYLGETQYEIYLNRDFFQGDIIVNPTTTLTRSILNGFGATDDVTNKTTDITTITVNSTLGFPDSGVIFIDNEGIFYKRKTPNQFLECTRGYINIQTEHTKDTTVYGPYYVETSITDKNGVTTYSRSWPLGLVEDVDIKEPGVLHTINDEVVPDGPGLIDPREQILCGIGSNDKVVNTFRENYDDDLVTQETVNPNELSYVSNITHGPDGLFFDDERVYVSTNGFPEYTIERFNTNRNNIPANMRVGKDMKTDHSFHVLPRRNIIKNNIVNIDEDGDPQYVFEEKGTDLIGVFVDGVRAFSNVSPNRLTQGKIVKFNVIKEGSGYVNPTVVITPSNSTATVVVNEDKGRITEVISRVLITDKNYSSNPIVRISSGENALLEPKFDNYGRITEVNVSNRGRYYNDVPTIRAVDRSGKGKGALLKCTVNRFGKINKVTIVNPGIDYNKSSTYISVIPVGQGAEVEPVVEYYQYNRPEEIIKNPYWEFDSGNGFLYEKPFGLNSKKELFGYTCSPTNLRMEMGDTGSNHSPILGWAFDGNPIYGSMGYKNSIDGSDGVIRQLSAYIRRPNRRSIIPSGGGETVGSDIPLVGTYPMGIFVEDYKYDPYGVAGINPNPLPYQSKFISTEDERLLLTNVDETDPTRESVFIETDVSFSSIGVDLVDADWLSTDHTGIPAKDDLFILTESDLFIELDVKKGYCIPIGDLDVPPIPPWILDRNNGKICNTPEFPKELYPDGIYAYFITVEGDNITPVFPYIIGQTFNNRPISQQIDTITRETITPLPRISSYSSILYDDTPLVFDFTKVERYRNSDDNNLQSSKTNLKLKIGSITEGGISDIVIQDSQPNNSRVGDLVYFNNKNTSGGGAQAKVFSVEGKEVEESYGSFIQTNLISHRQRLDLNNNEGQSFVFVKGTFIETKTIGKRDSARAAVVSYNPETMVLELQTSTPKLIEEGDIFYDNRGTEVITPQYVTPTTSTSSVEDNVSITSALKPYTRVDGEDLRAGDLWWSVGNGRMYVWYIWFNRKQQKNIGQWVCTQPIGMTPFESATDIGIGTSNSIPSPDLNVIPNPIQVEGLVTISNSAPLQRSNGEPNEIGDLWWSSHTGVLYIWNVSNTNSISDLGETYSSEWVCTTPSGVISQGDDATDYFYPEVAEINAFQSYSSGLHVVISETAPRAYYVDAETCSSLIPGVLWWSPSNGKLYIWYEYQYVSSSSGETKITGQWVVTNPSASMSSEYSLDFIIGSEEGDEIDGVDDIYGPITSLGERKDRKVLWFENLNHFLVGDVVDLQSGAPGYDEGNETAKISALGIHDSATLIRGFEDENRPGYLPDGTITVNTTRYLYTISTDVPHGLLVGDKIRISNSSFDVVNDDHTVIESGVAEIATGNAARKSNQTIKSVTITNPGKNYPGDFYVTFEGGGGYGALALAEVDSITGSVTDVVMINGRSNYTSKPKVIFAPEFANTKFSIYTSKPCERDNQIRYSVLSGNAIGPASDVEVTSPGVGYSSLPEALGLYKRSVDRAKTEITTEGGEIISIDVVRPGSRYVNPIVVFYDTEGEGSGAIAQVKLDSGSSGIDSFTIINSGSGYINPELVIIENDGKYLCETETIGKIKSLVISNPGRNISADRSLKPELKITTRCIVKFTESSQGTFKTGQRVYQGLDTNKRVMGLIEEYDGYRQMITLSDVDGYLKEGELLYNDISTEAIVIVSGQADCRVIVNGTASPEGDFMDDTSKVSESYPVIQDSYRYQWFSYVISSPIQKVEYDTFVESIIHPTGFIRFGDVTVHSSVKSGSTVFGTGGDDVNVDSTCYPQILLTSDYIPIIASTDGTEQGLEPLLIQDDCIDRSFGGNLLKLVIDQTNDFALELSFSSGTFALELNI